MSTCVRPAVSDAPETLATHHTLPHYHRQSQHSTAQRPSQHHSSASFTPTRHPHILLPKHVGAGRPELRQRPSQEQRPILRNSPRQLHQTKHPRIRWHCKHNCLEQCADKHHGATRVQQEVCCGRRRWMWKDVSLDQLQPGSLPRGECRLRWAIGGKH